MRPAAETIAAVATPAGRGGIGVVRVSGPDLTKLIAGILGTPPPPRVATVATFRGAHGEPLDQGIALYFPAPSSYTGETVLELHGHGGARGARALAQSLPRSGRATRRAG